MLYRVHRPSKPDGSFGHQLGYITLCDGHINIGYIWLALRDAKIIPESWFEPGNLHLTPAATIHGINAYGVARKAPHRTQLFYLFPVETIKQEAIMAKDYWYIGTQGTVGISQSGATFTYNASPIYTNTLYIPQAVQYIPQAPQAPPPEPQFEYQPLQPLPVPEDE